MRRAHRQQRTHAIKIHRIYPRLARASPELIQLLRLRHAPHADDGALVGGGREERAGCVEGEEGDGGIVCLDDVGDGEGGGVEEDDVAGLGGGGWGWGRGGSGEGGGGGGDGGGVGEVGGVAGGGEGGDGWEFRK